MSDEALVSRAASVLRRRLPSLPRLAIVLGSGMGDLDLGRPSIEIPYAAVPGFPRVKVAGHPGRLSLIGRAAILRGRVHYYEGHAMEDVTRPVRVLARLGVTDLVLTNAAGAVNPKLKPGDLMAITDHLNLMGAHPLRGGAHFVDLTAVYGLKGLRGLRKGVYAAMAGPAYETPAEIRMLRTLGADAVGMSTVPEAIAARQAGMAVRAVSVITNAAAGTTKEPVSHEDVLATAARARSKVAALLRRILQESGAAARP